MVNIFKVNIKSPERRNSCGVFIVKFKHVNGFNRVSVSVRFYHLLWLWIYFVSFAQSACTCSKQQ